MNQLLSRRNWLQQTSLALAGLGLTANGLRAEGKKLINKTAIQLGSNENPYGPPPSVQQFILEASQQINRYPDQVINDLKKKIAAHWGIKSENLVLGAGSSDIIGLACASVAGQGGQVLTTEPSYRVWSGQASAFGLQFKRNPLHKNPDQTLESLYGPVSAQTRMVYICNPNNPTGSVFNANDLKALVPVLAKSTLVFVDEAYGEYAQIESLAPLAVSNRNIIVAKTFSKIYGLAGARIGYAIGHPETIHSLRKFQPWPDANVSMTTAAAAMAALSDIKFVESCREKNILARELCIRTLRELNLEFLPSQTNFILFNIDPLAGKFDQAMNKYNIEVQFREHYGGKWCRVTMGTLDEMEIFAKALKEMKG